jgi:conjugal transfer pilin signal peptidase TrbI
MNSKINNGFSHLFLSKKFLFLLALPLFLTLSICWVTSHFGYAVNITESLPQKYFLVHFNQKPVVGNFIIFKGPENLKLPKELTFTKQVMGRSGDVVTRNDRNFFINGKFVGRAKTHSLKGELLKVGPTGVIPEGHYYVATDHKDSFDSRYQDIGWISISQCIGIAYPLW